MKTRTKVMAATFAVGLISLSAGHEADAAEVKGQNTSPVGVDRQSEVQDEKTDKKAQLMLDASATYSSQMIENKKETTVQGIRQVAKDGTDSEIKRKESAKAEPEPSTGSVRTRSGQKTSDPLPQTGEGQEISAQSAQSKGEQGVSAKSLPPAETVSARNESVRSAGQPSLPANALFASSAAVSGRTADTCPVPNKGYAIGNGEYYIAAAGDERQVLDVAGGNRDNGANVQLYRKNGSEAQRFLLTYHPEGYYTICSVLSRRLLEVQYAGRENGSNVDVYDGNETDAQRWILKKTSDGFYQMLNMGSGLFLNLAGGQTRNGTNVQVYQRTGSTAQKFRLTAVSERASGQLLENGSYYVAAAGNHRKVLDLPAGNSGSGTNVQVYDKNNTKAQQYRFVYRGNGYYSIYTELADRVLDVASASRAEGANVQIYDDNGSDAQLWRAESLGNGIYRFASKVSGKYLTMGSNAPANGTNVQLNRLGTAGVQSFYLSRTADSQNDRVAPHQFLANGTYLIASAMNENKVLDIPSADGRQGANVRLYDRNDTAAQRYTFMYHGDGTYTIYNATTGRVLDVAGANRDNGANVQLYDSNNSLAQRWKVDVTVDGYYRIISALSNKVLDLAERRTDNGTNVQLWDYGGGMNQKFTLIHAPQAADMKEGVYELHSAVNDRKVADLPGGSMDDGSNLQIYDGNGSRAQRFIFSRNADGSYRITSAQSGKVVTYDGGGQSGANVFLRENDDSINQRFYLADAGNGGVWLLAAHNRAAVLDLFAGSTRNGSNLQVYDWNGSRAQIFRLKKTDARSLPDGSAYRFHAYSNPGQVVDISAASMESGANAGLYAINNTDAQRFKVIYDSRGYYTLINVHSKKVLEVAAASHANGANVQQYASNDSLAQKWIIHETEDGSYTFINMASSKALDVPEGRAYSGANVQQWSWNRNNAQKFVLSDVVWGSEYVNRNSIAYDEFNRLNHQARFASARKHLGIDVSKHNGKIDWKQVKEAGVEFAIIRVGFRGVQSGALGDDPYALENLREAKAAGLKVGVYFYSQALNEREGEEEARYAMDVVRKSGVSLDLPVFMDYEYYTPTSGRLALAHISKDTATAAALAFYRRVEQEGYRSGIYASKSFFYEQLHPDLLHEPVWLAHYNRYTNYTGSFNLWQYSSTGHVPGIQGGRGNVDMNVWYE